jgi:hypothetical protein
MRLASKILGRARLVTRQRRADGLRDPEVAMGPQSEPSRSAMRARAERFFFRMQTTDTPKRDRPVRH